MTIFFFGQIFEYQFGDGDDIAIQIGRDCLIPPYFRQVEFKSLFPHSIEQFRKRIRDDLGKISLFSLVPISLCDKRLNFCVNEGEGDDLAPMSFVAERRIFVPFSFYPLVKSSCVHFAAPSDVEWSQFRQLDISGQLLDGKLLILRTNGLITLLLRLPHLEHRLFVLFFRPLENHFVGRTPPLATGA